MTQINATGFQMTRLDERFAALVAAAQLIFGSDINVDANAVDGQYLGIFAESHNNLDMLAEAVYQSFDPDTSTGDALSRLVKLNGITRQAGIPSTVVLKLGGTVGIVVAAGSLVQSADGSSTWITDSSVIIDGTGFATVQATCDQLGPTAASIGTLTKISTPTFGWQTVTNDDPASIGQYVETDELLRARRNLSTSKTAQGPLDAIRGTLLNMTGVLQAIVYENNTDSADTNGQPAHSINAVVLGGADQDIWDVLWFKRSAGVNVIGAHTGTVYDTAGFGHAMSFDRPTSTTIYITVNVKKRTGYLIDGATRIKNALVAFGATAFGIGQPVIQSELYGPTLAAINNTGSILSLYIGLAATPTTTADLVLGYKSIASFDAINIVVNES